MNGWELTTFDSSNDAKAAQGGAKECRLESSSKIFESELPQNAPERILD
jgi:hypothetical protein